MQVQEIMTRNVELTNLNTTVRDVARKMRADKSEHFRSGRTIGSLEW